MLEDGIIRLCNSAYMVTIKINIFLVRQTTIQTFQYKTIHRILACNEWLKNIKIKICNTCSFCNDIDTISHVLIDCNSNKFFFEKLGQIVGNHDWF